MNKKDAADALRHLANFVESGAVRIPNITATFDNSFDKTGLPVTLTANVTFVHNSELNGDSDVLRRNVVIAFSDLNAAIINAAPKTGIDR